VAIKSRILVLVESLGQGGAEKMAVMLAETLKASKKYDVYICAINKINSTSLEADDLLVISLEIEGKRGLLGRFFNYFRKINRLQKLKKELSVDLTISSLWPADWINLLTGTDRKIAIVQINILNNSQNLMMVRFRKIVQYVYNRFDRVVVGSSSLLEELTDFFNVQKTKIITIKNSINLDLINQNTQIALPVNLAYLFNKYNIIVAANRLHQTKNTESLIYILKNLPDSLNVKLLIIGEGEEERKLKEIIKQEGFNFSSIDDSEFNEMSAVYMLGYQKNIHNLIHHSKIFLFPTRSEGASLALLEALYCGTPVLVSDCPNGGVFEVMQGSGVYKKEQVRTVTEKTQAGFLMPIPSRTSSDSIDSWSRQISYLLRADKCEMQDIGIGGQLVASAYDHNLIRLKWLETIESVLQTDKGDL
jgi:glycosyltransferase involved in cell wall biosynthesis